MARPGRRDGPPLFLYADFGAGASAPPIARTAPMTDVLLLGAGTIGRMIAMMLARSGAYRVKVGDADPAALARLHESLAVGASYFDLTEDVATTAAVREVAAEARAGQIFMPQCGLAPGFVGIAANHLAKQFDSLDSVFLRVGALPAFPTNSLKYNLTW